MQVTLKPLKGDTFKVEVNPQDTIGVLKQKIAEAKADFPADSLKLIYQGKILTDDATVEASGVKEDAFVVVMAAKVKAKEPTAAAAPAPAPATPAPTPASATAPGEAMPDAAAQAAANVVTGSGADSTIQELCNMGFGRPEVERCLQAAFGNPDRAVEYLMNGIPAGLAAADGPAAAPAPGGAGAPPPAAGGAAAPPGGAAAFPAMPAGGGGGGGGGAAEVPPEMARLRTNPQFPQLARMVAQNPQMLAQILPALGQADPEAMQAVMQNPQAFMRMIQEEAAGGGMGGGGGGGEMAAAAAELAQDPEMLQRMVADLLPQIEQSDPQAAEAIRANPQLLIQMLQQHGMQPGAGGGGGGPPPNVVRLTDEENAAVERLTELGFDRQTAAEAYLACDKNEAQAANFLFDNADA